MLNNQIDLDKNEFYEASRSTTTRGHSQKLQKHSFKLETSRQFFSSRMVNVWNSLPEGVVTAPSLVTFKKRLLDVELTEFLKGDGRG